jgi:hypothetical protein
MVSPCAPRSWPSFLTSCKVSRSELDRQAGKQTRLSFQLKAHEKALTAFPSCKSKGAWPEE